MGQLNSRKKRTAALAARREWDRCTCKQRCPVCRQQCLGGHANYPRSHWCVQQCAWPDPDE